MLPDIYELTTADSKAITSRIVETAYSGVRVEPRMFSLSLAQTCVSREGVLDAVLGVKL